MLCRHVRPNALRPALFPVVLGDFGYDITCQACWENLHYCTRFQASSGNSDSANWPGYEAALRLCETLKQHLTGEKNDCLAVWSKKPSYGVIHIVYQGWISKPIVWYFEEQAMSLSVFHYNIVFALVSVTFQLHPIFVSFATFSSVFCHHFFCLMSLLQGMLKTGDLKPRRRMSTTGILTQFHPIPAEGPWMVSLWSICSVRSGQGSEFE